MIAKKRIGSVLGILLSGAIVWGCGGDASGLILFVDAEFDPATPSDYNVGISEMTPGVAQTFTVLEDGRFDSFSIILTDGESPDDGVVEITVRPVVGGLPDPDPASSIIDVINLDTASLPPTLVEEFTTFDVSDETGRDVLMGEQYAIVMEFVSRTGVDTAAIARVLGQAGDPYPDGNAADDMGAGYVVANNDYIFRTFNLRLSSN